MRRVDTALRTDGFNAGSPLPASSPGDLLDIQLSKEHRRDSGPTWHRVTPFKPTGIYPRGVFASNSAVFFADDEVVFSVTPDVTWRSRDDLPYSEVDWMQPELVRVLGALMFCERFAERRCWCHPYPHADVFVCGDAFDLLNPDCIQAVKTAVLGEPAFTSPSKSSLLGNTGCLFDASELSGALWPRYLAAISTSNLVLMRGIQALVKCDMLAVYPEFQEEAAIATFIAMDAAFELVRRHLKSTGIADPSSVDAARWLHDNFDRQLGLPEPSPLRFLNEFYPLRIQTLHPGSRYGDSPFAALAIDDRIHLRQSLPGLLAFLLTGVHSPGWVEFVEQSGASARVEDVVRSSGSRKARRRSARADWREVLRGLTMGRVPHGQGYGCVAGELARRRRHAHVELM